LVLTLVRYPSIPFHNVLRSTLSTVVIRDAPSLFCYALSHSRKKRLLPSSCPSVFPFVLFPISLFVYVSAASTGRIFLKLVTGDFFRYLPRKSKLR
jgi:hypothetical protein